MNEENANYLKDNLRYMGFGDSMNEQLVKNLEEGKESFRLMHQTEVGKKPFEALLNFRKAEGSDMYFFNSYTASLERSNGEKVAQKFYLDRGKGVTAREAYNLLEGRAVHKELNNKEGMAYHAWIQLDFKNTDKHDNYEVKQYHENYGYDLKAAVARLPIVEMKDPEKAEMLLKSLEKGNLQAVGMEKDGEVRKMFIEANPQFKTLTVLDEKFKRLPKEELEAYRSVKQEVPSQKAAVVSESQEKSREQEIKKAPVKSVKAEPEIKKKTSPKKSMSR